MRGFHHNSSSSSLSPSSVSSSSTSAPRLCHGEEAARCSGGGSLMTMGTSTDIDGSSSRDSMKSTNSCGDGDHGGGPPPPTMMATSSGFSDLGFHANNNKDVLDMLRSTASLLTGGGSSAGANGAGALSMVGKTYHCQRCLNHGVEIARKGHKRYCEFAVCTCDKCVLVEQRKILNREINSEREKHGSPGALDKGDEMASKLKTRNPKCARCGIHVKDIEPPRLKGHKKNCPYQNCTCRKCTLVTSRRCIMAKQIHLRRTQKAKPAQRNQGERRENANRMFDHSNKNFVFRRSIKLLKSFSPDAGKSHNDRRSYGHHSPTPAQHAAPHLPPRYFYHQRHIPPPMITSHPIDANVCAASVAQSMYNQRQAQSLASSAALAAACSLPSGTAAVALPLNHRLTAPLAPSLSLPVTTTTSSSTVGVPTAESSMAAANNVLLLALLSDLWLAQQQSQQNAQRLDNCLPPAFSVIHQHLVEAMNNNSPYNNNQNNNKQHNNEPINDKGTHSSYSSENINSEDGVHGFHVPQAFRQANVLPPLPPAFLMDRLFAGDGLLPQHYGLFELSARPAMLLGHQMFLGLLSHALPGSGVASPPGGALPFGLPPMPSLAEIMRI